MEPTLWADHWTHQSEYGTLNLERVFTLWLVTSRWRVAWSSRTTHLFPATPTLRSKSGTSPLVNVSRRFKVWKHSPVHSQNIFFITWTLQYLTYWSKEMCYCFCPSLSICICVCLTFGHFLVLPDSQNVGKNTDVHCNQIILLSLLELIGLWPHFILIS